MTGWRMEFRGRGLMGRRGRVTVTITNEADNPDGFSEQAAGALRENGGQFGLDYAQPYD